MLYLKMRGEQPAQRLNSQIVLVRACEETIQQIWVVVWLEDQLLLINLNDSIVIHTIMEELH
jgi:hypothetical protein